MQSSEVRVLDASFWANAQASSDRPAARSGRALSGKAPVKISLRLGCPTVTGQLQVSSSPEVANHAKGERAPPPRGACKPVRFGLSANRSSCVAPRILEVLCAASYRAKVLELVAPAHSRLIADGSRNWRNSGLSRSWPRDLSPRESGAGDPSRPQAVARTRRRRKAGVSDRPSRGPACRRGRRPRTWRIARLW